ncbi:MAG TPA: acyl carrier protein [Lachnospiraceae bacterium]|nr:acyl carrier protein [Lachnospiraceae bacterium]
MEDDFEKLKNIIADVLNVDPDEITEETTLTDDLGADSLDLYQILMGIEDEFGISADQEKVENIQTVGQALELIRKATGTEA